MAAKTSKVKTPLGMQTLTYYPIKTEPDSAHPTYDTGVDLTTSLSWRTKFSPAASWTLRPP